MVARGPLCVRAWVDTDAHALPEFRGQTDLFYRIMIPRKQNDLQPVKQGHKIRVFGMPQHVPTVEEIRAHLSGERPLGVSADGDSFAMSPTSVRNVSNKVDQLIGQVKTLSKQRGPTSVEEVRRKFDTILAHHDLEPVCELARMVMETRADNSFVMPMDMRVRVLETLAKFRIPSLKAMEVSGSVQHDHTITIVRFGEDGSIKREPLKKPPVVDVEAVKE